MDERKKKETGGKTNGGRRNLLNKQTRIYAHTSLGGWGGVFFLLPESLCSISNPTSRANA